MGWAEQAERERSGRESDAMDRQEAIEKWWDDLDADALRAMIVAYEYFDGSLIEFIEREYDRQNAP